MGQIWKYFVLIQSTNTWKFLKTYVVIQLVQKKSGVNCLLQENKD